MARTQNKTPRSQLDATRRWEERNREHVRKENYLRTSRLFVRKYADNDDIEELLQIYRKENPNSKESKKWKEL